MVSLESSSSAICYRNQRSRSWMSTVDVMDEVPDEILIDILSRLSIKDAARTSVLSRRWENLWKFSSGCLDFNCVLGKGIPRKEEFDIGQKKHIDMVNRVVLSHQGISIEQFRVCFDFGKDHTNIIHAWMEFAAARKVRRLELDLSPIEVYKRSWKPNKDLRDIYTFPTRLNLGDFKMLTSLRLKAVNVTDEHVRKFLSDSPLLEEISIVNAPSLHNFRAVGGGTRHQSDLKLKHLEIWECLHLEYVEVLAVKNLVSFKYQGMPSSPDLYRESLMVKKNKLLFRDVPQLSSVSLGRGDYCGDYCELFMATSFEKLPFPVSQLETLTLNLFEMISIVPIAFPDEYEEFSQFTNLCQLELAFMILEEQNMFFVSSFLRASPRLRKLVLKYHVDGYRSRTRKNNPGRYEKFDQIQQQLAQGCRYGCLKEVEFVGWKGAKRDVEFVEHLIEAAGSLERISVDPSNPYYREGPDGIAAKEDARNRARDLEGKLPSTVKFVVL